MTQNIVCHVCGDKHFENRRVEYIYRREGNYLIVRNVPCAVCLHCGELLLSGRGFARN
jgi:YgiT-type zinc finger domain-containing protein